MRPTSLGFDFIGVEGMPESRTASGEVALLRELLREWDLFVDVGANCGLYTLIACHSGVPVLAVEPNDLNFRRLKQNLLHNRYEKAEALNVAIGEEKGKCLLYGGGEGASLLKNWGGMASTYAREVEVETLDGLLNSRPSADCLLIKVDVEGHELAQERFHLVQRDLIGAIRKSLCGIVMRLDKDASHTNCHSRTRQHGYEFSLTTR
jgi:FkbM family methyltransferase